MFAAMSRKPPAKPVNVRASVLKRDLTALEGQDWGEPNYGSYVVRTSHALRRKPIGALTDEELRLALRQQIGLRYLIPLVLDRLNEDPFRAGDFYDGDVLVALLSLPAEIWIGQESLRRQTEEIASVAARSPQAIGFEELDEALRAFVKPA